MTAAETNSSVGVAYREVPLTRGMTALVDAEDFERVSRWNWYAEFQYNSPSNKSVGVFYAKRRVNRNKHDEKQHVIYLHRFVMNAPVGLHVDHCDRTQSLDCRKSNLRLATRAQNQYNKRKSAAVSGSRFKGVRKCSRSGDREAWEARIGVDYRAIFLGSFKCEEDAAIAYNAAAALHFGQFALLNKVD